MRQPIPQEELHSVLSQAYSDLYKELNGVRPRWMRFDRMGTPELERRMLALMLEAEEEAELVHKHNAELEAEEDAREVERTREERWMDAAAAAGCLGW